MKILIASDSFKDSLTAKQVGENIRKGLLLASTGFDIRIVPMADGGEGTVDALIDATDGIKLSCTVKDPLERNIKACFGISGNGNLAVIEMAQASGIELLSKEERNPWLTTSFGTGQIILSALDKGCRRFVCGIGGSATNDGGIGMAQALGVKFLDAQGNDVGLGGKALNKIAKIDMAGLDKRIVDCDFTVACDVTNPLTGVSGASYVYGPQKGANSKMVSDLDEGLKNLARVIKNDLDIEVENLPGAGAAGGMGAGFVAFLNGILKSGVEIVTKETNLEEHCKWADIVVTGEGKIDGQTQYGKTPKGVVDVAGQYNVPVIAIAGTLGEGYQELYNFGFSAMFSIIDKPMLLAEALKNAPELLKDAGYSLGKVLLLSRIFI